MIEQPNEVIEVASTETKVPIPDYSKVHIPAPIDIETENHLEEFGLMMEQMKNL